ncbi:hypothetical protein ERJ75_001669800 [Trypanosoma vivax]|uniref:Uncharacterized protein n=1 Tax=Trypanosoma vivax (strain Y486) TaxID=1055687 RepID=G0U8L8_TRYVY|nr:hypothetical protein ERJ75_001669800 [Trypanosoma vivax]CCC53944.1 conserved hypothetical protein [Trypanosoma vivax Y486]
MICKGDHEPRTTAERLRASRSREAALLYEQTFECRRQGYALEVARPIDIIYHARDEKLAGLAGTPAVMRRGDGEEGPSRPITGDSPVSSRNSVGTAQFERPLKVFERSWCCYDTPKRRKWNPRGHVPVPAGSNRCGSAPFRPSSSASLSVMSNGTRGSRLDSVHALTVDCVSCPSSRRKRECRRTNTAMPATTVALSPSRHPALNKGEQRYGVKWAGPPALALTRKEDGAMGAIIISKEEYNRIRQIISTQ